MLEARVCPYRARTNWLPANGDIEREISTSQTHMHTGSYVTEAAS